MLPPDDLRKHPMVLVRLNMQLNRLWNVDKTIESGFGPPKESKVFDFNVECYRGGKDGNGDVEYRLINTRICMSSL